MTATWYCGNDDPARFGTVAASIVPGDQRCLVTFGVAVDGIRGEVAVRCVADWRGAIMDRAQGM